MRLVERDGRAVDQVPGRYQQSVDKQAMPSGHKEVGMRNIGRKRPAGDPNRQRLLRPRPRRIALAYWVASDPLDGTDAAEHGRQQIADCKVFDLALAGRGLDVCPSQQAHAVMTCAKVQQPGARSLGFHQGHGPEDRAHLRDVATRSLFVRIQDARLVHGRPPQESTENGPRFAAFARWPATQPNSNRSSGTLVMRKYSRGGKRPFGIYGWIFRIVSLTFEVCRGGPGLQRGAGRAARRTPRGGAPRLPREIFRRAELATGPAIARSLPFERLPWQDARVTLEKEPAPAHRDLERQLRPPASAAPSRLSEGGEPRRALPAGDQVPRRAVSAPRSRGPRLQCRDAWAKGAHRRRHPRQAPVRGRPWPAGRRRRHAVPLH